MLYVIAFVGGLIFGGIAVWIIFKLIKKRTSEIEGQKSEQFVASIKETFGTVSREALSKNTEDFLKLANQTLAVQTTAGVKELEGKKELIDQNLGAIKGNLDKVEKLINDLRQEKAEQSGQLNDKLENVVQETGKLRETAGKLQTALASTKSRGQWGERIADDILKLAGFLENVNYQKQKAQSAGSNRPDFTFLLPQDLKLNMDVKFPLDNYTHYINEENKSEKERFKRQFLKDVKNRIKEVTTRDYINPEEHTLDYVLVFIPNEQVYGFLHENDRTILDEALKNKVILCSPLTLYAVLAVIRQAVDNFNLERTTSEILSLFGSFNTQWVKFKESFEKLGSNIQKSLDEFHNLTTTRSNKLEKPLRQIEALRKDRNIPPQEMIEGDYSVIEGEEDIKEE